MIILVALRDYVKPAFDLPEQKQEANKLFVDWLNRCYSARRAQKQRSMGQVIYLKNIFNKKSFNKTII